MWPGRQSASRAVESGIVGIKSAVGPAYPEGRRATWVAARRTGEGRKLCAGLIRTDSGGAGYNQVVCGGGLGPAAKDRLGDDTVVFVHEGAGWDEISSPTESALSEKSHFNTVLARQLPREGRGHEGRKSAE